MSYAKEKAKIESRIKRYKILCTFIVVAVILGLCIFGFFVPPASWKYYFSLPTVEKRKAGEMRVHFLSVGQGDSTLVEFPDGKIMLVDGGLAEEESVGTVMRYLNALEIKKIDALVLSHADSDHSGGLKEVARYKKIEKAFLPNADADENMAYATLLTELSKRKVSWEYVSRVSDFFEGISYQLFCVYPYMAQDGEQSQEKEPFEDNENSCVLYINYQGVGVLLTGDISAEEESVLVRDDKLGLFKKDGFTLSQSVDILKVPHHGSKYSSGATFLSHLGVKTAVVSCGKDNQYSHPHQETLDRLSTAGAKIYRTDINGCVCVTVNAQGEYFVKTQN